MRSKGSQWKGPGVPGSNDLIITLEREPPEA